MYVHRCRVWGSLMLFTSLLTLHLAGVALGLGGATIGDLAILRCLRSGQPFPYEHLHRMSQAIWGGLAILALSGGGMFALSPSVYLHNTGFAAKMLVVAALAVNGLFLHRRLPALRMSPVMLAAGAVSTVSWYGALLISMFRSQVDFSLGSYLVLYAGFVLVAWCAYTVMFKWLKARAPLDVDSDTGTSAPLIPDERAELERLRCENEVLLAAVRSKLGDSRLSTSFPVGVPSARRAVADHRLPAPSMRSRQADLLS